MVETRHSDLLRKVDKINEDLLSSNLSSVELRQESTYKDKSGKNLGLIPVLTEGNFHVVDFFIESSYKDGKTVGIIPVLLKSNFDLSDYFIESTYKDKSGKGQEITCSSFFYAVILWGTFYYIILVYT